MQKFITCLATGLALFTTPVFASPADASSKLQLEPLLENEAGGCGCSVTKGPRQKPIFLVFSDVGQNSPAVIRVGGSRRSLSFVSSNEPQRPPRVGDSFTKVYSDGTLRLTLGQKTTSVCKKNDESCEVTNYRTNVTLQRGREKLKMKGLQGDCGC